MRTVLFLDDDEAILHSLERGLIDEPYNKLFTNSYKEALEILQKEEVYVIVTDITEPISGGLTVLDFDSEKAYRWWAKRNQDLAAELPTSKSG